MDKEQLLKMYAALKNNPGECGWGEFYFKHSNLDMDGKPISLKCPFVQNRSMIRSEKACDKWKKKQ